MMPTSRAEALADLLQILVLEALVADLAPETARAAADGGRDDDAGREDQAHDAAGDGAALGPLLAAGIGGLLELDLAVGRVHDHGGVDQVDRAGAVCRLEVLQRRTRPVLGSERRDEELDGAAASCCSWSPLSLSVFGPAARASRHDVVPNRCTRRVGRAPTSSLDSPMVTASVSTLATAPIGIVTSRFPHR